MLQIADKNDPTRYEVPYELNRPENLPLDEKGNSKGKFDHELKSNLFSFKISRSSDGNVIFDTSMGGFIFR